MAKKGLGRGLQALIPEIELTEHDEVREVPLEEVQANPGQPRKSFDETKLAELAQSIREHGLIQPLVVRRNGNGYQLVAGERRWRAARMAGLERVAVVVKDLSPVEVMEVSLVENLQREDLNAMEEARAYRSLIDDFGLTQEELGRRLGRSRSAIANALRLLTLPEEIQESVSRGTLSAGHGRAILGLSDSAEQSKLAREAEVRNLSVRAVEELVKRKERPPRGRRLGGRGDKLAAEEKDLEERLKRGLGTMVKINRQGGKGKIEIFFYGEEDLTRVVDLLLMGKGDL
ncbi:MAG: ParB/RepB/Spo0J family partition protein [Firmicutes bacterium]|nr:ParB/RepB/Spo0J family partition protein [Bacillota bacterium]MCL5040541.1 ParB/RepB/Spo0J family partition protein [Bacillota bacterium]